MMRYYFLKGFAGGSPCPSYFPQSAYQRDPAVDDASTRTWMPTVLGLWKRPSFKPGLASHSSHELCSGRFEGWVPFPSPPSLVT
jgi:hypothetical protein